MVVLVFNKGAQRAVDGVVLAGLDLDRNGGQTALVVNQKIDLSDHLKLHPEKHNSIVS